MSLKLILWFKSDSQTDGQTRNESSLYHMQKFYALFLGGGYFQNFLKFGKLTCVYFVASTNSYNFWKTFLFFRWAENVEEPMLLNLRRWIL